MPEGTPRPQHKGASAFPTQKTREKTIQQVQSKHRSGPFSIWAAIFFVTCGAGLIVYFQYEKERLDRKRIAEHSKGAGKPKVGGPFILVDQDGVVYDSDERMKGKYALIYFGFSHCPDICPEELDKMADMIDRVQAEHPGKLAPIFVTCDPARDTPAVIKSYLEDFHPSLIGLTGSWEQIRDMCKLYRVYFSTPQGVQPGMDYLVDHSIYFYLMDPDGDFVEVIGRQTSADEGAKVISDHMSDWKGPIAVSAP
ncbi:MAG: Cu-binding protein [Vezdaea aestivalis]|nr:MAG: Cu-binding protein [Vezdaea aestivalis]